MTYYQLLLDVISEECYIYLLKDNTIIQLASFVNEKNLSNNLPGYVKQLLSAYGLEFTNINAIYWIYGPGKFSSSRIVSVFVKTVKTLNPMLSLFWLDKFSYLGGSSSSLVVLKSDANKYFLSFVSNHKIQSNPELVDAEKLQSIISAYNNQYEVIYDNNNIKYAISSLQNFVSVDENVELVYFKPPC